MRSSMMRCLLLLIAGLVFVTGANAVDPKDFFIRPDTLAVGVTGGDTPNEYSVSCSSTPAVLLRGAVKNRSRRKICFQNQSSVTVAIGTSTVAASDLFNLGESTNSATSPLYCTNSSGAYYCAAKGGPAVTVVVLEETQSNP